MEKTLREFVKIINGPEEVSAGSGTAYLGLIKVSDTATAGKMIDELRSVLPKDIFLAYGQAPNSSFLEVFGLKNNSSKMHINDFIDTVYYKDGSSPGINMNLTHRGSLLFENLTVENTEQIHCRCNRR